MPSHSLMFYKMTVNRPYESDKLDLANFDGYDMREVLEGFLQYHRNIIYDNDKSQQALGVEYIDQDNDQLYIREGQYLKGLVSKGDFGNRAPIKNIENNSVSYRKRKNDAEMTPLYFATRIRSGYNYAIFIIHAMGRHSAKSLFLESLQNFINNQYPDFKVSFETIVPNTLLGTFIDEGIIKKFRFIRDSVPDDITYITDNGKGRRQVQGEAELTIKLPRESLLDKGELKRSLESKKLEFIELQHFKYNKAKVEVEINGKTKVIDLGKDEKIAPRMDITEEIIEGDDGFPTFQSIDDIATDLLDSLTVQA